MRVVETDLPGVMIFEPKVHGDHRGMFVETFRAELLESFGLPSVFVQDNQSRSARGTLRGTHYQLVQPQGKLVRVSRGEVYDVAVDVRVGSPTFGEWTAVVLDDQACRQLYIPPGFAHGFCVLSETADFVYKCTDYYHPASERGVVWDDPGIGIEWPLKVVTLSPKDLRYPTLAMQPEKDLPVFDESDPQFANWVRRGRRSVR